MVFAVFERIVRRRCAPAAPMVRARRSRRRIPNVLDLEERRLLSITINIIYSLDTNNFFDSPDKRALMEMAAAVVASGLTSDHLSAILPSGNDTWAAQFPNPATGALQTITNLVVPADTIEIFVGGRNLTDTGEAGSGSTGGFYASGDPNWLGTVVARGDAGALGVAPSSYGPWGGSIAFDMSSTAWYFGASTAGLNPSATDFFTVAEHEIGHVLGIGTSPSWFTHVTGGAFTGPASMALHGGPVPLSADQAHFADGLQSDGTSAVMEPDLASGTRLLFTDLDYAALADVGWAIQRPSATEVAQVLAGIPSISQGAASAPLVVSAATTSAPAPAAVAALTSAPAAPTATIHPHKKVWAERVGHKQVVWSPRHKWGFTITLGSLPPELARVV
jgi:hypothetical protein